MNKLFGPVMTLWFLTIGVAGAVGIAAEPGILRALSPTYAVGFLAGRFDIAFFALAAVVLAITGAEAPLCRPRPLRPLPHQPSLAAHRVPRMHTVLLRAVRTTPHRPVTGRSRPRPVFLLVPS